ncbi:hypothetical protein CKO28_16040 [Rhodovibrio sodomensis]|uniref:MucR family transcriptional regulator n=2 Tax=Rhodovibrio sodomensis TaxID=1088 RepID=A0ABS1DGG2_9PROT|nr:hypothetical protein [Rhodovibrio sodomensis]
MVAAAHLRHPPTPANELPQLIRRIGDALRPYAGSGLRETAANPASSVTQAVQETDPGTPAPDPERPPWMPAGTFGPQRPPSAPAVPVDQTHGHDYVICLEDGRRMKMLKRHLRNIYGMTAEQYIRKWGLPEDYPLSCRAYREEWRRIASQIGFQPGNPGPVRQPANQPAASTSKQPSRVKT